MGIHWRSICQLWRIVVIDNRTFRVSISLAWFKQQAVRLVGSACQYLECGPGESEKEATAAEARRLEVMRREDEGAIPPAQLGS